jgi:tRNA G18 (ribose-2'-O)-methylase SpoU
MTGVGPHPGPWPEGDLWDQELLERGDERNVVDAYRYWKHEAIVADLRSRAFCFEVAIENWQHDFNIGTVVRNANAFGVAKVHVIGKKRWNRRGAMVTDRYLEVVHHDGFEGLVEEANARELEVVGIDLLPGSEDIRTAELPERAILLFGQEGPGLSEQARTAVSRILHIPQFGSTRSINAGVASGIAMYEWIRRFGPQPEASTD